MAGLLSDYLGRTQDNLKLVRGYNKEIRTHNASVKNATKQTQEQQRLVEQCKEAVQTAQRNLTEALEDRDQVEENQRAQQAAGQQRAQIAAQLATNQTSADAIASELNSKQQLHEQVLADKKTVLDADKQAWEVEKDKLNSMEKDYKKIEKQLGGLGDEGASSKDGLDAWSQENERKNLEFDLQNLEIQIAAQKGVELTARSAWEKTDADRSALVAQFSEEETTLSMQLDEANNTIKGQQDAVADLDRELESLAVRIKRGQELRADPSIMAGLEDSLQVATSQAEQQHVLLSQLGVNLEQTKQMADFQKKEIKARRSKPLQHVIVFFVIILGILALVGWAIYGVIRLVQFLT
ncbi:MAG: hypothetical protein LBR39_01935 [Coriobacteriales bacterium]|jgi:chromosome segregation ATPase|nr:hypothetical protein [Coriobacteriales bacterium]